MEKLSFIKLDDFLKNKNNYRIKNSLGFNWGSVIVQLGFKIGVQLELY